jgi:hypothetical protein
MPLIARSDDRRLVPPDILAHHAPHVDAPACRTGWSGNRSGGRFRNRADVPADAPSQHGEPLSAPLPPSTTGSSAAVVGI